jgi:hypothetical protein
VGGRITTNGRDMNLGACHVLVSGNRTCGPSFAVCGMAGDSASAPKRRVKCPGKRKDVDRKPFGPPCCSLGLGSDVLSLLEPSRC